MKTNPQLLLAFLLLGFIFSFVLIRFNIDQGIQIHNIWVGNLFQFIDFAGESSPEYLTTEFVGAFFYLWFGIHCIMANPLDNKLKSLTIFFVVLQLFLLIFNLYNIYLDGKGIYNGQHIRMRLPIAVFALYLYIRLFYQENNFKPTNNLS